MSNSPPGKNPNDETTEVNRLRKKLEETGEVKDLLNYADAVMKLTEDLEYAASETCQLCGGALVFMGKLGNRDHCRCRNCGYWCSFPSEEVKITVQGNTNAGTEEEG